MYFTAPYGAYPYPLKTEVAEACAQGDSKFTTHAIFPVLHVRIYAFWLPIADADLLQVCVLTYHPWP